MENSWPPPIYVRKLEAHEINRWNLETRLIINLGLWHELDKIIKKKAKKKPSSYTNSCENFLIWWKSPDADHILQKKHFQSIWPIGSKSSWDFPFANCCIDPWLHIPTRVECHLSKQVGRWHNSAICWMSQLRPSTNARLWGIGCGCNCHHAMRSGTVSASLSEVFWGRKRGMFWMR